MGRYRVIGDDFSNHGLPIGAVVAPIDPPAWCRPGPAEGQWFTQGGDGDEVAIDPRDLVQES